jgi:hypothetical protein
MAALGTSRLREDSGLTLVVAELCIGVQQSGVIGEITKDEALTTHSTGCSFSPIIVNLRAGS